ncbi:hypothetical protein SAY86_011336 [Trapa natans]|uniref:Uncharacterized protein n=1 Tax=Trapa natans TaxID=22666 RepID=A0AAN7R6D1_TRANT|nr:hypothetical protein SAY86_011336 [Trapa natans]
MVLLPEKKGGGRGEKASGGGKQLQRREEQTLVRWCIALILLQLRPLACPSLPPYLTTTNHPTETQP